MHLSSALAWMLLNTKAPNSCWRSRPCCIRDRLLVGPCSCWCSWTVQGLSQIRSLAPVHAPWLGTRLAVTQLQSFQFMRGYQYDQANIIKTVQALHSALTWHSPSCLNCSADCVRWVLLVLVLMGGSRILVHKKATTSSCTLARHSLGCYSIAKPLVHAGRVDLAA